MTSSKRCCRAILKHRSVDSRLPITPDILVRLVQSLDFDAPSDFQLFHAFLRVGEIMKTGACQQHYLHAGHVAVRTDSLRHTRTIEVHHFVVCAIAIMLFFCFGLMGSWASETSHVACGGLGPVAVILVYTQRSSESDIFLRVHV